ncbi:unnamed protein product [Miscanthus lutarioriparius]|uniref:dolichol kinase n=1 Tax=Miscanthus lutarioriparius TaxID=422564 RepID=A0A811PUG2_9POAL|nr:unnamed protein product [Miscanthus lutarioriparius]
MGPGASSGILLGATTLPSVMLSRLIQLSRLLPTDPNGPKEFAYLEMQYWAASISCLSLLALFLWHLRKSPSNGISKRLEYGSLLIVLYLMTFFLSFLLKTDGGLMVMTDMVYMLCHGVAAVILIKHILEKFPSCASFGEALLVSGGLVLYFGDMLAHTLSKPAFLDLAFGAAFAVFSILEMIRFMNAFTDHRDSEILIVSHFSLLLGCALPKWMSSGLNDRPLAPFAGILSLGIGDTMKTIEGTAAGITSVLAAWSILVSLLASSGYILSQNWFTSDSCHIEWIVGGIHCTAGQCLHPPRVL